MGRGVVVFTWSLFLFWISPVVFADVYPWVRMRSQDIRMIPSAKAEAQFRVEMIRSAKNTIDLVTFDQRSDEMGGWPVIQAVREAADRNVKVRFLTSWSGHILKDPLNLTQRYLSRPPTSTPIEFHIVGGIPMWRQGWATLDGIHEKLLIIDGKWVMATGRGHAGEYFKWMDTAFVFRGELVQQSMQAFNNIWTTVSREMNLSATVSQSIESAQSENSQSGSIPTLQLSSRDAGELEELKKWLNENEDQLRGYNGEFYQARLLHHDFLNQLRKLADRRGVNPRRVSYEDRLSQLVDPIVEEVIRLVQLPTSQTFKFFSLSTTFVPKLKTAIMDASKRGMKVEFLTNGREAHRGVVPIKLPLGWYAGLGDLDDLIQAGSLAYGLVKKGADSDIFLHRKVSVIDDTVFFGSHNLNLSSSIESDEISFEIVGPSLAKQVSSLFESSLSENGEFLNKDEIHEERLRSGTQQWICDFLEGLY